MCVRRPSADCLEMKNLIESALLDICWEAISNISAISIEGTMSVVIGNTDILIIQLDKVRHDS